jgi:nitroreductase
MEFGAVCAEFNPFPSARAILVREHCDEVFKGAIGTYGKIKCARAFIAFIGDMNDVYVQEKAGYLGEGLILEATALQLATCWVGGFFRPDIVASLIEMEANEKILGITPVGYAPQHETLEEKFMTGFGRTHGRKPLSSLVTGLKDNEWPEWIRMSLEAARKSPSAVNRQPWGFHIEPDSIKVFIRTRGPELAISKRLDCGIAMLHIEVAAMSSGVSGKWEFLDTPLVARFKNLL